MEWARANDVWVCLRMCAVWGATQRLVLAVAVLTAMAGGGALARPTFVPTSATFNGGVMTFSLRRIDMLLRNEDPNLYPMFGDLPMGDSITVTAQELEAHLDAEDATRGPGLLESQPNQARPRHCIRPRVLTPVAPARSRAGAVFV